MWVVGMGGLPNRAMASSRRPWVNSQLIWESVAVNFVRLFIVGVSGLEVVGRCPRVVLVIIETETVSVSIIIYHSIGHR
jgi:hypothetical protein